MYKIYLFLGVMLLSFTASAQLDNITGVTLTFTPTSGATVIATATDSGSGLAVDGNITLMESADYALTVTVESAGNDINSTIISGANDHQVFFAPMGSILNGDVMATDTDGNGLPLGLSNSLTTECTEDANVSGMLRAVLADLTGIKTAASTIDDGSALFDLTWMITVEDDVNAPPCENEEEIITDVILTWTPTAGGDPIIARAQDPDGEGPLDLEILDEIALDPSTEYTMTMELTNSIEGEDITEEIREEDDEHMFFFAFSAGIFADPAGDGNVDNRPDLVNYNDFDENNLPVGLSTSWTTEPTMTAGTFRVILKHQPDLKSETTTVDDGGTDVDLTFSINTLTSIKEQDEALRQQLVLAPNPANNELNWRLTGGLPNTPIQISIISMTGQVIRTERTPSARLNISKLPAGSYMFRLQTGQASTSKRFIKLN